MASNDGPLPTPPRSRFGRPVRGEEESTAPLTADRLAQAAAEGQLEEFLQHGIPEGEHARHLTMMMLGMSGMMAPGVTPPGAPEMPPEAAAAGGVDAAAASALPGGTGAAVPPEVQAAVLQADVVGLMSLLQAEHARRSGEGASGGAAPAAPAQAAAGDAAAQGAEGPGPSSPATHAGPGARVGFDQALVDELIRVAADNQVSVDWLLLRAVKLYLEEHRRTGRL